MDETKYLAHLKENLLKPENFRLVILTIEWAGKIPSKARVYVFKDNAKLFMLEKPEI